MSATLFRQGTAEGELEEFETWMETRRGAWSRRCLFAMTGALAQIDPREPGLTVALDDGTRWDLHVVRFATGSGKVFVTSAMLEPATGSSTRAA
jgi:hypothetical protein